jgi:hypothetical protein
MWVCASANRGSSSKLLLLLLLLLLPLLLPLLLMLTLPSTPPPPTLAYFYDYGLTMRVGLASVSRNTNRLTFYSTSPLIYYM